MSTDLYEVKIEFIGPPSERLEDLPWLTAGVRRLATLAKLQDAKGRAPADLLDELSKRIAAASPGAAAKVIPADTSNDKDVSGIIKQALLHRHHPDKHEPKQHLGVFTVRVIEPGSNIPPKNSDRVWFSRFLWEIDEEHPLRKEFTFEKIFARNFYLSMKHKVEMSFTNRSKSGASLYVVAPPDWFSCLSVGGIYRTTAYA